MFLYFSGQMTICYCMPNSQSTKVSSAELSKSRPMACSAHTLHAQMIWLATLMTYSLPISLGCYRTLENSISSQS